MGVAEDWVQPNGMWPNGLLPNVAANVTRKLDEERWLMAEERTAELIARIQPNKPSEERRNAVAGYVQQLIMKCFPCQVFTFGSVPLKTYLPDGDIDLTAFSKNQNIKDTWANDVRDMLEIEERREDAEFRVKEVQYIQAEVDILISQNHLFKRSIILIKAWCYYESRILGVHHGLISTYALETLVLYIFHIFNNSFTGPLEVLYRFLELFSNFDWENFCVSLWGPVSISQLPDITAEPPRKDGGELLLSKSFLDACGSMYAVYPGMQENQGQLFPAKHFNVIDPLRTNNNLGRSVSKGNFFRIRSAFSFGARKLTRLLECPKEHLTAEVNQFFMNTWERHGSCQRPDVPCPDLWHPRPPNTESAGGMDNPIRHLTTNRKGHHEGLKEVSCHSTSSDGTSITHSAATRYNPRLRNPSGIHRSSNNRNYNNQIISAEKSHNGLKVDYSKDVESQAMYQFSLTRSSPEPTETSLETSVGGRRTNKASKFGKDRHITTMPDQIYRRKNGISQTSLSHQSPPAASLSHKSSKRSSEVPTEISLSNSPNCYALGIGNDAHQNLQQEAYGFPVPRNLASSCIPVPLQPSLSGYPQRNFGETMPTNLPFIDRTWASGVGFPPGIISSQLADNFSGLGLASNQEEIVDSFSESSTFTGSRQDKNGAAICSENDNVSADCLEFASSRVGETIGDFARNCKYKYQNSRATDINVSEKTANLRSFATRVNSSKLPQSAREKWERKAVLRVLPIAHEKSKPSWHYEGDASAVEDAVCHNDRRMACSRNEGTPTVPVGLPVSYETGTSGSETMIPGPMLVGSGSRQITFYPTGPPVPFVTMLPIYNFSHDLGNSSASPKAFDRHENSLENGHANISEHDDASSFAASENLDQTEAFVRCNSLEASIKEPIVEVHVDILNSDFTSHWQNLQYGRICQSPRNGPPLIYSPQFVVPPVYLQGRFPWEGPGRPSLTTNVGHVSQKMSCGPHLVPVAHLQSSTSKPRVYQRFIEGMPRFRSGTGTYLPNRMSIRYLDRESTNRSHRGSYNHSRNEHGENDRSWNHNSKPRGSGRSNNRYDARAQADKLGSMSIHQRGSDTRHDGFTSFPTQNEPAMSANPAPAGNVTYDMYRIQTVNSNDAGSSVGGAIPSVPSMVMLYPYEHGVDYTQSHNQLEFGSLNPLQFGGSNAAFQNVQGGGTSGLYEQQHGLLRGGSPSQTSPGQPSSPQFQRRI